MSEKVTDETESSELEAPNEVAIEGKLPLTAIDIESQKDMESGRHHKLRSLHKWFAARPTPAARLAVLGSVYPGKIDADELLRLMQIGPKQKDKHISEYVEKKFSEDKGGKTLDEHYGYENPNTQSPTSKELEKLHNEVREGWGGELPKVLDPTAGRGIIPFEAMRYGFSVKANELNSVPSVILQSALKHVREVGSLSPDIYEWRNKIHAEARENIDQYYPTQEPGNKILNSACTFLIRCDSCEGKIPLTSKWWVNQRSGEGDAIRPNYNNGEIEYEHVKIPEEVTKDEFDPSDGPVTRRSARCPHCTVVTESDRIEEKLREGAYEYSVYGVNYETESGEREFRAGSEADERGMRLAAERVESDFDLMTFLTEPIDISSRTNDPRTYGMEEWRDIFTPRQLIVHYEYLQAYEKYADKIKQEYDEDEKSEAILTLLSLCASRSISFSSKLSAWYDGRGCPDKIFQDNNFALKRMFADNNLSQPRRGYIARSDQIIDSYEELTSYAPTGTADICSQDAATLSESWEPESVDVAVIDPPYYDSIMYSELSEVFYVLQKEYLSDLYPDLFTSKLSNKSDEAVANPYRFEEIADNKDSKEDLADRHYENKMAEIFDEVHELLTSGGVATIMFTHRDMEAWDTLTKSLIEAGFSITATHPIKTEMSDRIAMRGSASADSSIFLIARKLGSSDSGQRTLWSDIKSNISDVAKQEAKEILESGYSISKTDMAIAAYGPTLQQYAECYPVVDKKGSVIKPRKALGEARRAVTSVIAERFLKTEGIEELDALTRWYILAWLIYENDTFPYDEGRQLGVAADVDIDDIKRPTKLWGKRSGDIQLKGPDDRVQDIVMLQSDSADNPSTRKYPINPTDSRFTYTIDAVHAVLHVYERQGAKSAWDWLTERNLKSDEAFEVTLTALLEVLPEDSTMYDTLVNLISGETGEYLDINVEHIDMSGVDRQTSLGDHTE
jgi:adenine-specific DNA methylase